MRILYGISSEGAGHATRSLAVIEYLRAKGHTVHVCTGERAAKIIQEQKIPVTKTYHIPLVYKDGKLAYLRSFLKLFMIIPGMLRGFTRVRKAFKKFKPHITISDYDVFTSFASHVREVPLIAADNISVITKGNTIKLPGRERHKIWPKLVDITATCSPDVYVIPTFFPVKPKKKNAIFTAPPIRKSLRNIQPKKNEHLFVYQTSSTNTQLLETLKQANVPCIVYGYHTEKQDGNLTFKKFNQKQFQKDLATARACILGGGFSLISEALFLKKPILCVPLKKHYEQCLNAAYIERQKLGMFRIEPTPTDVHTFLKCSYKTQTWDPDAYAKAILKEAKRLV